MLTPDVLVLGGGPAGAMAAMAAAKSGAKVLLVERKRRLGALPHCAEYISRAMALEVAFPPRSRVQPVSGMETFLGGESHFTAGPGWILDRQVFDHGLGLDAAGAGAEVLCATRFLGFQGDAALISRGGETEKVFFGALVAADGAASAAAALAGWPRPPLLAGVQVEVPLAKPLEHTMAFLEPEIVGGYAWLFPKGACANLGLGCLPSAGPRRLLENLRELLVEQEIILPGVLASGGGAIRVDGPYPSLVKGTTILAGDAAGLTHPVSGAGIPQALFSGRLAGAAAARLAGGDNAAREEYQAEVLGRHGRQLARGVAARQDLQANWGKEDFAALMKRTWIAWAR